jgi:hypothetical protein
MTSETSTTRTAEGRFAPGHSGNPAGRPKGARNRATLLDEMLREGEAEALVRRYIEEALGGDKAALRLLFRALVPLAKGRPFLLEVEEPGPNAVATYDAALRAIVRGEMSVDEGLLLARLLKERNEAALREAVLARQRAREAAEAPAPREGEASSDAAEAPPAPAAPAPLNRHERRRLAALDRRLGRGASGAACISPVLSGEPEAA